MPGSRRMTIESARHSLSTSVSETNFSAHPTTRFATLATPILHWRSRPGSPTSIPSASASSASPASRERSIKLGSTTNTPRSGNRASVLPMTLAVITPRRFAAATASTASAKIWEQSTISLSFLRPIRFWLASFPDRIALPTCLRIAPRSRMAFRRLARSPLRRMCPRPRSCRGSPMPAVRIPHLPRSNDVAPVFQRQCE